MPEIGSGDDKKLLFFCNIVCV